MKPKRTIEQLVSMISERFPEYKYTYDKSEYVGKDIPMVVGCPEHGDFNISPNNILRGKKCKHCSMEVRVDKMRETHFIKFMTMAPEVHGNEYGYELVTPHLATEEVEIICPVHGVFKQTSRIHLKGHKCFACSGSAIKTTQQFIDDAKAVHGDMYDYSMVDYRGNKKVVNIICKEHGVFPQIPANHITHAMGCPSCNGGTYNPSKETILYYLKINGGEFYKIGITSKSIKERFDVIDLTKIEVLKTEIFASGRDAYNKEQEILNTYADFRCKDAKILKSGNTELFCKDVLGLDNEKGE